MVAERDAAVGRGRSEHSAGRTHGPLPAGRGCEREPPLRPAPLVNQHPLILNEGVGVGAVDWQSPRADDAFAESIAIRRSSTGSGSAPRRALTKFWPLGGPQWDALGLGERGEVVLVEAKAHVKELLSTPTQATGDNLKMIQAALFEAASALGAMPGTDWSQRFYQYANRLAHAWFLADANEVPARLVFVHFIGDSDMDGPSSRREWEAALTVLHEALGLRGRMPSHVVEAFIDVRPPTPRVV